MTLPFPGWCAHPESPFLSPTTPTAAGALTWQPRSKNTSSLDGYTGVCNELLVLSE